VHLFTGNDRFVLFLSWKNFNIIFDILITIKISKNLHRLLLVYKKVKFFYDHLKVEAKARTEFIISFPF